MKWVLNVPDAPLSLTRHGVGNAYGSASRLGGSNFRMARSTFRSARAISSAIVFPVYRTTTNFSVLGKTLQQTLRQTLMQGQTISTIAAAPVENVPANIWRTDRLDYVRAQH